MTPWLKVQMAQMVLGERGFVPFRVHFHNDLLDELQASRPDGLTAYLRNELTRALKVRFQVVPMFYLVMEELEKDRITPTLPHAHGSIELPRVEIPKLKSGKMPVKFRRIAARKGIEVAELIWAKRLVREAIKVASGNTPARAAVVNGRAQYHNVWVGDPTLPIFNDRYVSYVFKNGTRSSPTLGKHRLGRHQPLIAEARRLWTLVTEGEAAISQWP